MDSLSIKRDKWKGLEILDWGRNGRGGGRGHIITLEKFPILYEWCEVVWWGYLLSILLFSLLVLALSLIFILSLFSLLILSLFSF